MTDVRLAAVCVPGDAEAWRSLGFTIDHGSVALSNGAIRPGAAVHSIELEPPGRGDASVEGIPIRHGAGGATPTATHPNGAVELDHVVVVTDSIDRTSAAIAQTLGLAQRRVRETPQVRQAFHRFADEPDGTRGCIIEVVERPGLTSVDIWGLVVIVADLDLAVAASDGLVGAPKPAVQPGRRIATVSRSAGLPLAVALMSR